MDTSAEMQEAKNREIVKALRELFSPLTKTLTPDVEPATIYEPTAQESDPAE